jgi:hypothetical protein
MNAPTKTKRRWLQFSLRGLLLMLTLAGIWLGRHVERVRRQKYAVGVWTRHGAEIGFRHQLVRSKSGMLYFDSRLSPPGPAAAHRLLGDEHFESVIRLRLVTSQKITEEDFAALAGFPDLRTLEIYARFQLTKNATRHLRGLRRLERLVLANADGASDASASSDACVDDLGNLVSLHELFLLDGAFSEADIAKLRRAIPECKIVR